MADRSPGNVWWNTLCSSAIAARTVIATTVREVRSAQVLLAGDRVMLADRIRRRSAPKSEEGICPVSDHGLRP